MVRLKLVKLMKAILFFLLGMVLALYFIIVGTVGVFVISQDIMGKICGNYGEASDTRFFIINVTIASFLGMLPFGLIAAKCIPAWFEKWKIPTIQEVLEEWRQ
ncbi:MAG: hypothetical protein ACYSOI_05655 [Planctomycetota bacterium]|jgi:hypothetical protein